MAGSQLEAVIRKGPPTAHPRLVVRGRGFRTGAILAFSLTLDLSEAKMGGVKGTIMAHHVALSMPVAMQVVSSPKPVSVSG